MYCHGLNPLKRVNSILTKKVSKAILQKSKVSIPSSGSIQFLLISQSWIPYLLKVSIPSSGSIQFLRKQRRFVQVLTLSVSIPSSGSIQFLHNDAACNICNFSVSIPSSGSIQFLPNKKVSKAILQKSKSQSPQAGQFNSYYLRPVDKYEELIQVSVPSSGSIQFLQN